MEKLPNMERFILVKDAINIVMNDLCNISNY